MRLCLGSSGSICVLNKGSNGLLNGLAGANALQHVPPLGTSSCPARGDLVVIAQEAHELGVLAHNVVAGVDVANALANGEVGGSQNACANLVGVSSDEVDKGLGCLDLGLVAVVEDAEAPDAAAQLGICLLYTSLFMALMAPVKRAVISAGRVMAPPTTSAKAPASSALTACSG